MTVAPPRQTRRRPSRASSALSPEQLAELLRLLPDSDSVELKLTVADADQRSAVQTLDMDPLDAQIRQIAFFDTPDLALNRQGVVLRARRVQRKPADAVVKLRPVVPSELSPDLRKTPGFGVEVDAMPGGFVCSASLKAEADPAAVRDVMLARRPISKAFTKAQRAFFAVQAPGIDIDSLAVLGPVNVLKLKFTPADLNRRVVAELWFYPDGTRILELSTKCTPPEAFTVAAEARAFLGTRGIDLYGEQQTKTKTALRHFARQLAAKEPT